MVRPEPRARCCSATRRRNGWNPERRTPEERPHSNHRYALAPAATRQGDGKTLGIDSVFGGYPLNKITREYIQAWVNRLTDAGKKPSTVRHAFFTVRMVLEQAVVDGRLAQNPAEHVKLPMEHSSKGGKVGVVDDPAQFLTAAQVSALVARDALAVQRAGPRRRVGGSARGRAGGLTGRRRRAAGPAVEPERPGEARPAASRAGCAGAKGAVVEYVPLEDDQELPAGAVDAGDHRAIARLPGGAPAPRRPDAPLWPGMALTRPRPTGVRADAAEPGAATTGGPAATPSATAKARARRQAEALAELTAAEAEERLVLDWDAARCATRRSTRRCTARGVARQQADADRGATADLKFHALRHTYASLCVAAGIRAHRHRGAMGHRDVQDDADRLRPPDQYRRPRGRTWPRSAR